MSLPTLTPNAVADAFAGRADNRPIIVQVLSLKQLTSHDPKKVDRWRVHISDGQLKSPSVMLATQLNHIATSGKLQRNAIVQITKCITNVVSNKRILIILAMEVLVPDAGAVIGAPQAQTGGEDDGEGAAGAAAGAVAPEAPRTAIAAPTASAYAELAAAPASAPYMPPRSAPIANPYAARPAAAAPAASAASLVSPGRDQAYVPINGLNPYNNRWCIRVRVTGKSAMKKYTNQRGEGQLFSVDLVDESSEIRATAFNEVAGKLYDVFEVNKVYLIRGGRIKQANKKFTSCKNDFEISFDDTTSVAPIETDDVPRGKFSFLELAGLDSTTPQSMVDVLAVCIEASPVATIQAKTTGKELSKRDTVLVDRSGASVTCTLWGREAVEFATDLPCVFVLKNARVSDYGGRSLSAGPSMMINPDMPEALDLLAWYTAEGRAAAFRKLSGKVGGAAGGSDARLFLSQVKDDQIGVGAQSYFSCKGTVTFIKKDNCLYQACPSPECNKKVVEETTGTYRCEKCAKSFTDYKWRLMASVNVADATGSVWVTAFQEAGELLFGKDAQTLGALKLANPAAFDNAVKDATFGTWMFRCRAKEETYNDDKRVKISAVTVSKVDYSAEARHLAAEIKKFL